MYSIIFWIVWLTVVGSYSFVIWYPFWIRKLPPGYTILTNGKFFRYKDNVHNYTSRCVNNIFVARSEAWDDHKSNLKIKERKRIIDESNWEEVK